MNFQNLVAFGISGVSLAACIGWPGARIIEDTLGTSVTAQVIRTHWMAGPEQAVKTDLPRKLREKYGPDMDIAEAEEAGFACGSDTAGCVFEGTIARELLNLPAENRARAKERLRFRVVLHRAQPIDVTVAVVREPMP